MSDEDNVVSLVNPPPAALPEPPAAYRWLVLVVMSLAMFGNYYVYDCLNPLEDIFLADLGIDAEHFGLLFSAYSLPNLAMLLVSGVFIDRIGARKATTIFAAICLVGAVLSAVAGHVGYWMMLLGRCCFGLGAESLIVAVTAGIARWFKGKELSFAFGINLTIARLGSMAADWSPRWAKFAFDRGWQGPMLVAVVFALVSLVTAAAYWGLEEQGLKKYSLGEADKAGEKIDFRSMFSFGKTFWLVVAMCVTFYSAIFPFRSFSVKFFQTIHGLAKDDASALNSSLIFGSMIFTPIFGMLVDKIGRRATLMVAGTVLLVPNYFLLMQTGLSPWVPMALMGISFSLIPAVMWPSVAYLAPEGKYGSALGIMTMCQQVGMMVVPWVVGRVNTAFVTQESANYVPMMGIFTGLVAVGIVCAVLLLKCESGPEARGLEQPTPGGAQA